MLFFQDNTACLGVKALSETLDKSEGEKLDESLVASSRRNTRELQHQCYQREKIHFMQVVENLDILHRWELLRDSHCFVKEFN